MISVDEAFKKFKSRLELNSKEQENATKRHTEIREHIRDNFKIDNDFLTGSYARHTKTKPLKDIDIFFVLSETENHYLSKNPNTILNDLYKALNKKYENNMLKIQGHSISVDFGVLVDANDNTDHKIVSIDVVPAFVDGNNFQIPDKDLSKWIKTNPKIHAEKAITKHQSYGSEWKGLVRMVKYWNNNTKHGEQKPVKPSFLLEVMALECLHGGWGGSFEREIQALFSTLADRIHDRWDDPASLGPTISDGMDTARKQRAESLLKEAARQANNAIHMARQGKNQEALKAWRELFGPKFPLS